MKFVTVFTMLTLSLCGSIYADESLRLQGDEKAVARVEKMIHRLGGPIVWKRMRTLHLVYHGWRTNPDEPVKEHGWRDLTAPAEYIKLTGRSFFVIRAFDSDSGWFRNDEGVRAMTDEELERSLGFWPGDFYTMIRRFAVADQDLRLTFEEPNRVTVRSAAGADLGWWEIDSTGQPVRWGSQIDDHILEYVYLPVRSFGTVNFPVGGAATDGFWRWVYETVDVSTEAIPMSLEMPAGSN